jgi:hypothetical protein
MNSFIAVLLRIGAWLGRCWRGHAFFLIERELQHERTERKREYEALWQVFQDERAKAEAERQALLDRILQIKGVQPVHHKPDPRKPTIRDFAPDAAAQEALTAKRAEQEKMRARAEAWKLQQQAQKDMARTGS